MKVNMFLSKLLNMIIKFADQFTICYDKRYGSYMAYEL